MKFGVLSTTAARRLAIGQKVMGIPFMGVYENGARVEELVKDAVNEASVEALIQKHI